MQKKLIALAIASAMTVPVLAYAEVNISGQANMSVDMVQEGAPADSQSTNQLNSNQSRIVFNGSEDLGNGLSAKWQLDSRLSIDRGTYPTSTGKPFDGNTYLGLKSNDLGTVMVGRLDTPYKSAFRGLDVFFDVAGDNRSGVGPAGGGLFTTDARLDNVIAYMSPDMSGFSVSVASAFGAEAASSANVSPTNAQKKGQALILAAMYKMDNIYGAFGYQSVKLGDESTGDLGAVPTGPTASSGVNDEAKTMKLGGGYTMDAFTLNAEIEKTTYTVATAGVPVGAIQGDETGTNFYIAGKFAVNGSDNVRAAYTARGETTAGGVKQKNDATQIAIGYDHSMSKATSVYATYVKTTDSTKNGVGADIGPDPSVLSFGMKHAF